VPADPFLRAIFPQSSTDFSRYTSQAHKQAVRTVMSCRPGSTILVNLPTGSGKSTVALAPAFVKGQPVGVSVVVVPTIALALDQERRMRELLGGTQQRFAYTQSTPKEERRAMRQGLRDGVQTVVFVSPESVTGTMSYALFDAARAGHLRYFVVDEAHLVDQWGTEFRPDFQAMAGIRRELLDVQQSAGYEPFRTVLMTATLAPSAADLLVEFFGQPGPVETAISNLLRPEPAYWVASFGGWRRRSEGLLEALRHLPRPAVVYTTQRRYAHENFRYLQEEGGFRRLALFTGETGDEERRRILEHFRDDRVDLVVATSAFGLGVDQDDIRTVVHACIPETIDRYYQEVGRGGRDGRSSISLICWTAGDRKDAHILAHPKMIGEELGVQRWNSMFSRAEPLGSGRYRLPMAVKRLATMVDSEENEKWNVRTLGLLARSGVVKLSWDVPPSLRDFATNSDKAEFNLEDQDRGVVVEIAHGVVDSATWQERVEPQREAVRRANTMAHKLMLEALKEGAAICELIARAYDMNEATRVPGLHHGKPAILCGRCPAHPSGRVAGVQPLVWPANQVVAVDTSELRPLLGRGNVGLVTYRRPTTRRDRDDFLRSLAEVLRRLVPAGIRLVIAPTDITRKEPLASLLPHLHGVVPERTLFLEERGDLTRLQIDLLPQLPALVIVGGGLLISEDWVEPCEGDPPRVVIVWDDVADPEREDRHLVDLRPPVIPLLSLTGGRD
jgi:superfamily II DNA/RNA helicase